MRKILVLAFLFSFGIAATAQEMYTSSGRPASAKRKEKKETGFDRDKLIIGGGIALSFGQLTNLGISPMVGYAITPKFSAGLGLGYQHLSIKNFWEVNDFKNNTVEYKPFRSSVYSGSVWARYLILPSLFGHVELEYNTMSFKEYGYDFLNDKVTTSRTIYSAPSLLVGLGFRQPLTDRASFSIMALYDALNGQNEYSPYGNQIFVRGGISVGF
jgi:hypothetical protein